MLAVFVQLEKNTSGAEDVAGVIKSGVDTFAEFQGFAVMGRTSEVFETVHGVEDGIQRLFLVMVMMPRRPAGMMARLFFVQMGGIQQHQPRQFA